MWEDVNTGPIYQAKKIVDILSSKQISRMGLLHSRKKGGEDQTLVGLSAPSELSWGSFAPLYLQGIVSDLSYWSENWLTPDGGKHSEKGKVHAGQWMTWEAPIFPGTPLFPFIWQWVSHRPFRCSPSPVPFGALLSASHWIYSPPYLILIKDPFSLPLPHPNIINWRKMSW